MATYKERLRFLIDRGFIGIDTVEDRKVLFIGPGGEEGGLVILVPFAVKTVEEAIDKAIENGIGGADE